CQQHNHSPPTF
nr:immunoglobulin light chain junction region [Macaca mulatta]